MALWKLKGHQSRWILNRRHREGGKSPVTFVPHIRESTPKIRIGPTHPMWSPNQTYANITVGSIFNWRCCSMSLSVLVLISTGSTAQYHLSVLLFNGQWCSRSVLLIGIILFFMSTLLKSFENFYGNRIHQRGMTIHPCLRRYNHLKDLRIKSHIR
jgi:hypothetical protein